MPRRKTCEEYKKEFEEQAKGEYLLLSSYKGALNKVKVKHLKCGTIYEVTPTRFKQGTRCPECAIRNRTKTTSDFKKEISTLGNNEYELLSDYINNHHKVKLKHLVCDTVYTVRPNDFISGRRCPYCGGGKLRDDWLLKKLSKVNNKVTLLDDYKDNKTPLKVKCSVCNNVWSANTSNLLQGYGCPICNGTQKKTFNEYKNECSNKRLDLPIDDYVNNKTKIKHKCSKGHIYEQTPSDHLQGHGCPICSESHGEKYIRNYLDKNNIKYIPQKKFHDLKDKAYLSYDFYLPEYNILIEYQGIQHYESVKFNGKDSSDLDKQQLHDNLKRAYAKDNGYRLLELKYTLNTQELVDRYLKRRIKD